MGISLSVYFLGDRMKILFLNLFYDPLLQGGTEHSLKLLAEGLASRGVSVSVITFDGQEREVRKEWIHNVAVYRLYAPVFMKKAFHHRVNTMEKLRYYIGKYINVPICRKVKKLLDEIAPDILHTQNFFPSYIWKMAKKEGIITGHTTRDYFLLDPQSSYNMSPRAVNWLHQIYQKHFCNKYLDFVTSPSEFILQKHLQEGYFTGADRRVIVNAVDVDVKRTKAYVDERIKRQNENYRILYAGALTESKGIRLLLRVFTSIQKNDISLVICGDGPLRKEVLEMAKRDQRIHYRGNLKEELEAEYRKADILVVPSVWEEPFGRILIEGARYGLPVIGSNRGGIPEIVNMLGNGECVDPENERDLQSAILRFLNREYIVRYISSIPEHIRTYSLDYQLEAFIELYTKYSK